MNKLNLNQFFGRLNNNKEMLFSKETNYNDADCIMEIYFFKSKDKIIHFRVDFYNKNDFRHHDNSLKSILMQFSSDGELIQFLENNDFLQKSDIIKDD